MLIGDDAMKLGSMALGALLLSVASVTPAAADYANIAQVFLAGPELPNYLTAHGPARCTWADHCWYRLQLGLDVGGPAAVPVVAPVAPRIRK
jgi:hypothetical protein